ncbi:hypothetical protein FGU65_03740 [Methanoculleus sp. FWC-SCC1]|uniref:Uncharacterized protein n=1 Tax=Methanoculleus frigidifontis TaxID=2584085 RepID=A0ABT8M7V6_9EURY|nr:hypothetical protein [Methanoculleus sp. FWC-SCC1]MDN7024010.1 hypothetical protein [Methanoculleus sp. FWC-SCC1]
MPKARADADLITGFATQVRASARGHPGQYGIIRQEGPQSVKTVVEAAEAVAEAPNDPETFAISSKPGRGGPAGRRDRGNSTPR